MGSHSDLICKKSRLLQTFRWHAQTRTILSLTRAHTHFLTHSLTCRTLSSSPLKDAPRTMIEISWKSHSLSLSLSFPLSHFLSFAFSGSLLLTHSLLLWVVMPFLMFPFFVITFSLSLTLSHTHTHTNSHTIMEALTRTIMWRVCGMPHWSLTIPAGTEIWGEIYEVTSISGVAAPASSSLMSCCWSSIWPELKQDQEKLFLAGPGLEANQGSSISKVQLLCHRPLGYLQ